MYQLITDYRDDASLRHSFNRLAEKTFGLSFEDWYQNGLWSDSYRPFSIVRDGEIVANVSVNKTDMLLETKVRHFLQLGTVMTDEAHRRQGLIRELMARIDAEYSGKCHGIYLFANDSVLDFYPRFGFEISPEYESSGQLSSSGTCQFEKLTMNTPANWQLLKDAMGRSIFRGRFDMVDNPGLILFYVTKFLQENVYFHRPTDTWVIAQEENGRLLIHNIFSGTLTETGQVLNLFGSAAREVVFGFTPPETEGYTVAEHHEEDCTLFIKGDLLKLIAGQKLRIPSLSHA